IPHAKLRSLIGRGVTHTLCRDFNEATAAAHRREEALTAAGHPTLFLPSDPEHRANTGFGTTGMDSAHGLATLLLDLEEHLGSGKVPGIGSDGHVSELRIPTSGGATYASCVGLQLALRENAAAGGRVGLITAAYDAASPTLPNALSAGSPRHATEVEWQSAINGLAQPEVAPGAWTLLEASGALAPERLFPVTAQAAELARMVIEADTGVRPEPAGAASVGSQLLLRLGACAQGPRSGREFRAHAADVLAARLPGPVVRRALDLLESCAGHPGAGGVPPVGARVYVVSGMAP
ncbi:MAG TPA: hypothetical protein VFY14_04730, partial [Streptomyces sp.]|nr:hypothetical protein [Streptomyces sp.]